MPYKEKVIEKKYFTIGDVARQFNVATSLIRFWESEFSILKPKKNRKGNRQFTRDDIENVKLIYHLVKERGFTLNGAKEMLKNERIEKFDVHLSLGDLNLEMDDYFSTIKHYNILGRCDS